MLIEKLLAQISNFCAKHQLVPGEVREGPMSSGMVDLNGKSRRLRLVLDRGEPVLEMELPTSKGAFWFDATIIQNCVDNERLMPAHGFEDQIKFMDSFLGKNLDSKPLVLVNQLEHWRERRASRVFGDNKVSNSE